MSTTNKSLPACDCLNHCGDDPWVKGGKAAACDKLKERREQDLQRALETARVNLLMLQYGVTTVYDLVDHLHTKVEQLPTNIDPRWADIDFDKLNAEMNNQLIQIGRLRAYIDRTQPVKAGEDGYVEPCESEFLIGIFQSLDERKRRDAAFESVRQRLIKLPRYSFHLRLDSGAMHKVNDPAGNWIEFDAAHQLLDPVAVDVAIGIHPETQGGTNG